MEENLGLELPGKLSGQAHGEGDQTFQYSDNFLEETHQEIDDEDIELEYSGMFFTCLGDIDKLEGLEYHLFPDEHDFRDFFLERLAVIRADEEGEYADEDIDAWSEVYEDQQGLSGSFEDMVRYLENESPLGEIAWSGYFSDLMISNDTIPAIIRKRFNEQQAASQTEDLSGPIPLEKAPEFASFVEQL